MRTFREDRGDARTFLEEDLAGEGLQLDEGAQATAAGAFGA
jgi:hypothetical protein